MRTVFGQATGFDITGQELRCNLWTSRHSPADGKFHVLPARIPAAAAAATAQLWVGTDRAAHNYDVMVYRHHLANTTHDAATRAAR